ncbi:MAG: hypothetical protein WA047_06690 [Phenylobacterium sp.]|uniref:hypothetical protein n=1 Tax=Phenylobacterium sp. TaxID=1871053 RepID=UPI003BB5A564
MNARRALRRIWSRPLSQEEDQDTEDYGLAIAGGIALAAVFATWIVVTADRYVRDVGFHTANVNLYAKICQELSGSPKPSAEACIARANREMSPLPLAFR